MDIQKLIAIALIIAGALGARVWRIQLYQADQQIEVGPLQLSVDEKEYVNVPVWAGIGVILVGGLLCLWVKKASDRINQLLIAIGWHYVVIRN